MCKRSVTVIFLFFSLFSYAQQDQELFFMHYLSESNFMNPAVQSECKWFIGIPVLSSVHFNYANSAFSYNQIIKSTSDSTAALNIDRIVNKMGRRTLIGAEFHTTLLALGYKWNDYYFTFSVIEKINLPFTISKDVVSLAWQGNSQFEGQSAQLNGTAFYPMYYREYALGLSKINRFGSYFGIKGKLLFGKLNISTPKTNVSLFTDPTTFNLVLRGTLKANSSLPVIIDYANGQINAINYDNSVSPASILMNRKNWGIAVDLGFIHYSSSHLMLAGSILDLGFIRWRSDLNTIKASGNYYYTGPLRNSLSTTNNNYWQDISQSFSDSINYDLTHHPYFTFLPVKAYLGAKYEWRDNLDLSGLVSAIAYRTKLSPALTLAADYNPFGGFHFIGSYSLFYRSFNNVGLGISLGHDPVQFYVISDNAAGLIWPLSARNINLRFGLNINLGCRSKKAKSFFEPAELRSCPAYENADQRAKRKRSWRK